MLTDRGTEYCGNPEHHEYELYLGARGCRPFAHQDQRARKRMASSSRFHKTVLDEFYRVVFRKKIYGSIAELQADLDAWVQSYNEDRAHQGRWCFGKMPMQTFLDATLPLAKEENDRRLITTDRRTRSTSPDADRQIKCQLLQF